jgi:hypothetical protein
LPLALLSFVRRAANPANRSGRSRSTRHATAAQRYLQIVCR